MKLITAGFLIVFIGMLVILAGVFSMEKTENSVRGGGIIMIGPIPIIFGTDVGVLKILIILAIVLMAIAIILFFLPSRIV
jgi:uncharacterized protein (TIGR00304 family)